MTEPCASRCTVGSNVVLECTHHLKGGGGGYVHAYRYRSSLFTWDDSEADPRPAGEGI